MCRCYEAHKASQQVRAGLHLDQTENMLASSWQKLNSAKHQAAVLAAPALVPEGGKQSLTRWVLNHSLTNKR